MLLVYVYFIKLDHTGKSIIDLSNLRKVKGTLHTRQAVEQLVPIDKIHIFAKLMILLFGNLLLVQEKVIQ